MCKHLSACWFPMFFSPWAPYKSALCSNADRTDFFLPRQNDSSGPLSLEHPADFPIPASWLWLHRWLFLTNWCNYEIIWTIRWTGITYRGGSLLEVIPKEYTVPSRILTHSTHLLQVGPKPFTTKILYSLGMFDVFAWSSRLHDRCGHQERDIGSSNKIWDC